MPKITRREPQDSLASRVKFGISALFAWQRWKTISSVLLLRGHPGNSRSPILEFPCLRKHATKFSFGIFFFVQPFWPKWINCRWFPHRGAPTSHWIQFQEVMVGLNTSRHFGALRAEVSINCVVRNPRAWSCDEAFESVSDTFSLATRTIDNADNTSPRQIDSSVLCSVFVCFEWKLAWRSVSQFDGLQKWRAGDKELWQITTLACVALGGLFELGKNQNHERITFHSPPPFSLARSVFFPSLQ